MIKNRKISACLALCLALVANSAVAAEAVKLDVSPLLLSGVLVKSADTTEQGTETDSVQILHVMALENTESIAKIKALLGKPLSQALLMQLLSTINAELAAHGEQFSVASFPEQDLTSGKVTLLITRASVGEVRVKNAGEKAFSDDHYRSLLRIKPGDVLQADTLDEEIDWINRSNPYRNAQVMTQPGKQIGQTDLELLVTDRRPYGFSVGYDNNGTRITGRNRFTLTAGWGNVFGLDHQLSYTLNANQNLNRYLSHSLNYVIPLPWHHLLSFSANASHINPELPAPFNQSGISSGFSARYDVPLKKFGAYTHEVNVGFDYKRSNNNLLFSQAPVTNTLTKIYQFNLGYSGTLQDRLGQTTLHGNWVHSPGGIGNDNEDATFNASRVGATADYNYWQLGVQRVTRLPHGWSWTINGNFQFADSNLLGSEQLSGGGVNSVRGFAEAIAFGDEGHVIRTELVSPAKQFGQGANTVQLQGLVFYDNAYLSNKHLLPGETSSNRLSSWGVGARASLPHNISVKVDAGKQITADVPGANTANLVHVGVSAAF
jgi:hemolysin activation/secretion protein